MPTPNEKLAEALTALQELHKEGRRVFRTSELSRTHRARLTRNAFVQEVIKGWLISSSPNARDGDSTPWYALLLGILRSLLRRPFWRAMASLA
jgi:hypothetical protein